MPATPDFERIVFQCSGMLAPLSYQRIYEAALRSTGDLIVEVGTYKGAATVSLALGLRDAGKAGRVISFDRGRSRYDGIGDDAYLRMVKQNLRLFGVEDFVELILGEIPENASAVSEDARISLLMLDADGCIDRDIALFFNRVVPGGGIIIDDCDDRVRLRRTGFSNFRIDSKTRLAYLLLSYFKSRGLISEGTQIKETYFGEKLRGLPDDKLDLNEILEIYRQLIFTSARMSPLDTARSTAVQLLAKFSPAFLQHLRVLYRRMSLKILGSCTAKSVQLASCEVSGGCPLGSGRGSWMSLKIG